ncbi:hypothetical protein [Micromonospora aurantiaca (nom. illeg.)]|uniref:hypothetical protein n=1 Tax=Micromonospora aurantiaca (nom. illeg.) TaxID=47850 RepID=UPI0001BF28CD|nr:hypothetical protein [Micromonospora aurantiaca]ADL48485.1 hypothetical protein Micau_4977 [Micromonospora aurantiaca ATCC 27029]
MTELHAVDGDPGPDVAPPAHLGDAGREFFVRVAADYDLTLPEEAALLQVAETIDALAAIEAAIRETGPVVNGRPSPLLVEARQQRAILVRLLGLLDLPIDEAPAPRSGMAGSRAASKAARARWDRAHARGERGRFHG